MTGLNHSQREDETKMDGKLLPPGGGRITGWLGLDVGGTFTDLAYIDEAGMLTRRKVPSTPATSG